MSDYPMLISNKLHSFRNFFAQSNGDFRKKAIIKPKKTQNLMANNKFSINFYYICTVL